MQIAEYHYTRTLRYCRSGYFVKRAHHYGMLGPDDKYYNVLLTSVTAKRSLQI
jgi:hypothetical protein